MKKDILIFAEQKNGVIHKVTYELIGKARELLKKINGEIKIVILGNERIDLSELSYHGANKVYHIIGNCFNKPDEVLYKDNIVQLVKEINPEIFLVGATSFGRSLAPRIAASLNTGLTADCTELKIDDDGDLIQIRPAFSDNILAHIKTTTSPKMATIRYKEFAESERNISLNAEIINLKPYIYTNDLVEVLNEVQSKEFDISEAQIVVSAGKGFKNKEDLRLIYELAKLIGGEVGASRSIVDDGYIDKGHQIGYSGNRVKAKLYIACGISGAPQHLAGMKESDVIIAINSDPSAPIFNIADYGIVGDIYTVIPMFIEKFKRA